MGAVFGLLAALCIGLMDLTGRRVVHATGAITVTVSIQLIAMLTALATVSAVPSKFSAADILLGVVSGFGMGLGLAFYFGGLDRSSSAVVAPLVATLSAIVPLAFTVVRGSRPSVLAYGGSAVAILGLLLITVGGESFRKIKPGLLWGTASGMAYGIGLSVLIDTTEDSGSWPAVTQRLTSLVLMLALATAMRVPVVSPRGLRRFGLISGALAGGSTIFYLLAIRANAPAGVVTASMFPAVSVAIGWAAYGDSVRRGQIAGLVLVLAGVAGVVTG